MIAKSKHKTGSSGESLGYMLGGRRDKDQIVRVIAYNGFPLSRLEIAEIESVPDAAGRDAHKKAVHDIANNLSKVFDARAALADSRVKAPLEEYIISCFEGERERLGRIPEKEELTKYGLPEDEQRTLWQIINAELLEKIGVHGDIQATYRRKEEDGKMLKVKKTERREAMFIAVEHRGTKHPHLHVLTARPDANGKCNDTRMERLRIKTAIEEMSHKYGLCLKSEGYTANIEKVNDGYAAKLKMQVIVKAAIAKAVDHHELEEILCRSGVSVTWKVHANTGEEYGVIFSIQDKRGVLHHYSGSQLGRNMSYRRIESRLRSNMSIHRQHAVEKEVVNILKGGYNSFIVPIYRDLSALTYNCYQLYEAAKKEHLTLSRETRESFSRLSDCWKRFKEHDRHRKEINEAAAMIKTIGVMLSLLNPIIALVLLFLGEMAKDIHRAESKKLLRDIQSVRKDIETLEEKKAGLKVEKNERLGLYLQAKDVYKEYIIGKRTVDNEIQAAVKDIKRKYIIRYIESQEAQNLLYHINSAYCDGHDHLVHGKIVEIPEGIRWELWSDGYTSDNNVIYNKRIPAPQSDGKSYVDFTFCENGDLMATVEADSHNYYTKGVSGVLNITKGEGRIVRRQYAGSKEAYEKKQREIEDISKRQSREAQKMVASHPKLRGPRL